VTVSLVVEDVHKRYGAVAALSGVTLAAEPGEIMGLLGANGAGKTTLVSLVSGLRRPDAGAIRVGGVDVVHAPTDARALVGVAPQTTGLYEVLTIRQNLVFFGELCGLRRRALAERVEALSAALLLEPLLDRSVANLSGGEKRRAHTAVALVGRPPLLLLDEPTVGADVETRAALLHVVRALADDGSTVVYSTHYLPEVEVLGASVAMLDHGRLIARGSVRSLVAQHGAAFAELQFDGIAPACSVDGVSVAHDGDVLRVTAPNPAAAAATVIARLGAEATRLRGIEVLQPNLDSVFLALTGRRYSENGEAGVAAA
jgi:ABC-type multidrug transport system ATPase subunit